MQRRMWLLVVGRVLTAGALAVGVGLLGTTTAEPARGDETDRGEPMAAGWQAGTARVEITPDEMMWMSGYGARDHVAEGKLTDLWAKALALEDPAGHRALLITLDLVGIDRELAGRVCRQIAQQHDLKRADIALCTSHTHTGPVVGRNLRAMYWRLDEAQWQQVDRYTARLEAQLVELAKRAFAALEPCRLAWTYNTCTVAVNRRNNREAEVPRLRAEGRLVGPVDHDVPVLAVRDGENRLRAVVFGYACHATVLDSYLYSGDYPGFAQMEIEKALPGVTALFWAGCGADQNPIPRRRVELAKAYGRRLAQSVLRALDATMVPIEGPLRTAYAEIDLPFDKLPTREQIEREAQSSNHYTASRAKLLLEQIDRDGSLSPTYPYPVQLWQLGRQVRFIILGGEVVVDFALRLKRELGPGTWVAAYANDVMAYIPSRRVLNEGGYEGGGAMVYYGLPTVWAPQVEELIVRKVHELAQLPQTK